MLTVVAQLLHLALSSGTACVLAYGQTGAGKTYTMEGLETRIARDLFVVADHVASLLEGHTPSQEPRGKSTALDVFDFTVTFLELLGKRAVDLLEPDDQPYGHLCKDFLDTF